MATDGRLERYQEDEFPNLVATGYRITSRRSRFYNCFAWAAGEDDRWWNPLESNNSSYYILVTWLCRVMHSGGSASSHQSMANRCLLYLLWLQNPHQRYRRQSRQECVTRQSRWVTT